MTPEISVVVPVYRTEPWLRECADSILGQTFSDLELILVDDGSPDGCGAICDAYAEKDPRVRAIHKQNGGVMSALLAGIRAARAPWVGFVDSDDWIDADFYDRLHRAALASGADIVTAPVVQHAPGGTEELATGGADLYPAPDGGRRLLEDYFRAGIRAVPGPDVNLKCDKLYRRTLLDAGLPYFPLNVWCGEDLLMNIAVLADCACAAVLRGGPKYHYRRLSSSAASTFYGPVYEERHARNDLALQDTLERIVRDKSLDLDLADAYRGQYVYWMFFRLHRAGGRFSEKRDSVRLLLSAVPGHCLRAYARERKNPLVRFFCLLLRARAVSLCLTAASLCSLAGRLLRGKKSP